MLKLIALLLLPLTFGACVSLPRCLDPHACTEAELDAQTAASNANAATTLGIGAAILGGAIAGAAALEASRPVYVAPPIIVVPRPVYVPPPVYIVPRPLYVPSYRPITPYYRYR